MKYPYVDSPSIGRGRTDSLENRSLVLSSYDTSSPAACQNHGASLSTYPHSVLRRSHLGQVTEVIDGYTMQLQG
jgi:hypothetical protein